MSDEEAFEAASDLVLAPAEKDPLAQKGQPISKEEREAIYRKLEAMAIAQERPLSRESLENVFEQMLSPIELCVAARLGTPSLILLYSAIDIAGWLNSEHRKVQDRFTEWVDKYLLPNSSLKCTALDLYGARCGLVHSYSSDSDLSRSGKVTPIGYA